jgi:hypothetical protein
MKIGSIVIRCYEFEKMLAFWGEALHYVPREPVKGGWVVLRDPEGRGPNVSLDHIPEKRTGKRRRLDIRGDIAPMMISSCWRIPMIISSVWFRSPAGLESCSELS